MFANEYYWLDEKYRWISIESRRNKQLLDFSEVWWFEKVGKVKDHMEQLWLL